MLREAYGKMGFDKLVDSISNHKIQINELLPAIKGDLILGVVKVDEIDPADSVTQAMNGLQVFLSGSVNDQGKFQKIIDLLQAKQQDSSTVGRPNKMKPAILSDGSTFVISLSSVAAQKFLSSAGNNVELEKLITPYKNYPAVFIIDLKTIFGFAMQSMAKGKSEEEMKQASEVLGMFDKMICYGSNRDDKSVETTLKLTFTNKEENSLKQFLNMVNLFYSWKPKPENKYN